MLALESHRPSIYPIYLTNFSAVQIDKNPPKNASITEIHLSLYQSIKHKPNDQSESKATFTLLRFHFDPFLGAKTELFSSLFTLLRFQTETDIYQLVFTLFLKNASVFLFLTTRPSRLLILAFSNCSVFGVHTTELCFSLAPFSFSSVFIIVFI